jgi:hypothetical protein
MRKSLGVILLLAAALGACGDSGSGTTGSSGTPASSGKPAASTSAASPKPSTSAAAAPSDSAATPAPSGSSKFACGSKEDPCPMQKWMKENVGKAMKAGDKEKVAAGLKFISEHAPPGFDEWKAIAEDGAKKAATNLDEAGANCKKCHTTYQEKWRAETRDKPWP